MILISVFLSIFTLIYPTIDPWLEMTFTSDESLMLSTVALPLKTSFPFFVPTMKVRREPCFMDRAELNIALSCCDYGKILQCDDFSLH